MCAILAVAVVSLPQRHVQLEQTRGALVANERHGHLDVAFGDLQVAGEIVAVVLPIAGSEPARVVRNRAAVDAILHAGCNTDGTATDVENLALYVRRNDVLVHFVPLLQGPERVVARRRIPVVGAERIQRNAPGRGSDHIADRGSADPGRLAVRWPDRWPH